MSEHDAAWLQAARMEALEAEVRRLQTIEDALLTSEAKTERYKAELGQVRADTGILEQQLQASQAEVERLRAALATYAVDPTSDAYYVLYCTCIPDGVDRSQIARDALTPPAAPEEK